MKRAYRTRWGGVTSIVAAKSRAQARARTWKSAENAGYQCVYTEIRVVRAPEHDAWAAVDATGVCWDEGNLPKGSVTR